MCKLYSQSRSRVEIRRLSSGWSATLLATCLSRVQSDLKTVAIREISARSVQSSVSVVQPRRPNRHRGRGVALEVASNSLRNAASVGSVFGSGLPDHPYAAQALLQGMPPRVLHDDRQGREHAKSWGSLRR